jgi:hypothetical protein
LGVCSEPRFIRPNQAVVSKVERSSKAKGSPVREAGDPVPPARAHRARDAWRKFTEMYGIPRARLARAMYGEKLRKFTESRARRLRACYAVIFSTQTYSKEYSSMYTAVL